MLLEYLLSVHQHGEARRALVLDFGTDPTEALIGGQKLAVGSQHVADVHFIPTVKQYLLIDGVDLLEVGLGSGRIASAHGFVLYSVLASDLSDSSDQLVDILLGDVDMAGDNDALFGALLNVDSHNIENIGELVAGETADLHHGLGRIRLETLELGDGNRGEDAERVAELLVELNRAVNDEVTL